eukprot:CAMPEP_0170554532 /NCGR_PEP_ID=MMETSP0211-20121228/12389_1 /TAXON_ID=311385 /ORGANISM="Pseudokeronopsis sp., Strain OXSARD2" /LENGTH=118 /DNA_ID=CAMNT_0010863667 /DNA_START=1043 /DNA_END=1399 /DNA_ORIENTATION=-
MPSSSVMVKGQIVKDCDESILMDAFLNFGHVKDVRLVKEKETNTNKDFAFVEFHSIDDAMAIVERAKNEKIKVQGQNVIVCFSKYKRPEQYFESYFDQSQGIQNKEDCNSSSKKQTDI